MKKLFSIIAVFLLGALTYAANQYGILDAGSAVALAMAVPAAVGGTYSEQFISLQGMNLREFYPTLVRKFGTQGIEFFGDLVALGWTQEKAVQRIEHWEDDWIWDNFKVMAQAGGGATATLTIDPDSIDADGNFYPQATDIIEFPVKDSLGNYIQAYITAIGATTIDVRVLRSGWTIPATTNNQQLFVVTNYSAEGTGQPASKVRYFNLYQNDFAIIKTKVDMTGSEMTDSFWFKTPDGVVSLASMELDYRQLAAEQNAALSGVVPQSVTQSGKPVKGTKGLFPTMNQESIQMPYTTWGMSNFDIMNKALSRVYAGNITGHYYGLDLYTANENMLTDFFKHTNVDYVTKTANRTLFGDSDGELAATVMFSYIEKSKRVHAFKMIDALNNPKTYGSDGFDYQRRGFSFPMKNDNLDVKSKAKVPSICAVYRKKDGYSRVKEMFTTGSANAAKYGNTDDVDVRALNCRTEMGMEFFAANQFLNIKPA